MRPSRGRGRGRGGGGSKKRPSSSSTTTAKEETKHARFNDENADPNDVEMDESSTHGVVRPSAESDDSVNSLASFLDTTRAPTTRNSLMMSSTMSISEHRDFEDSTLSMVSFVSMAGEEEVPTQSVAPIESTTEAIEQAEVSTTGSENTEISAPAVAETSKSATGSDSEYFKVPPAPKQGKQDQSQQLSSSPSADSRKGIQEESIGEYIVMIENSDSDEDMTELEEISWVHDSPGNGEEFATVSQIEQQPTRAATPFVRGSTPVPWARNGIRGSSEANEQAAAAEQNIGSNQSVTEPESTNAMNTNANGAPAHGGANAETSADRGYGEGNRINAKIVFANNASGSGMSSPLPPSNAGEHADDGGTIGDSDRSLIPESDQENAHPDFPDIEPPLMNRRCARHQCNTTSTVVLELVFVERVVGIIVAIGIEHVKFLFRHNHNDSSTQLKRRYLEEYEKAGYMEISRDNLKRKNMRRAAKELKRTKTVYVRRKWIFSSYRQDKVQRKFFVIAKAAQLICSLLGHRVIPHGEFRGHHLEFLTPEVTLNVDCTLQYLEELFDSVNREQLNTFGTINDVRDFDSFILRFGSTSGSSPLTSVSL